MFLQERVHRLEEFEAMVIVTEVVIALIKLEIRYVLVGAFKRIESVGNLGRIYLAVRLFDDSGANIGGDGTWWYYPVGHEELADSEWHTYSVDFGPGFGRAFPPEANTMSATKRVIFVAAFGPSYSSSR